MHKRTAARCGSAVDPRAGQIIEEVNKLDLKDLQLTPTSTAVSRQQ